MSDVGSTIATAVIIAAVVAGSVGMVVWVVFNDRWRR